MNILVFTEYFPESKKGITGGVEARYFYLIKELADKVTIITSWREGLKREERIGNARILRVGPHHPYTSAGSILSRLAFARACYKNGINVKNIDVVEGGNFITYLPAYFCAKKLKKPAIATYHEVWIGRWIKYKGLITGLLGNLWERIALKLNWDMFISVSRFTKNELIKVGTPREKIKIVNNGIQLSEFNKIKANKSTNPSVCYVGRLIGTKRIEDIIKAISLVKKEIPEIKCNIVGEGPEKDKLKSLVKSLNLKNNVIFHGLVKDHKDVLKQIKQSHIFCSPSSVEGFGIVLIEAMALGVPIVTSDIEPFKEINQDGKTGLIFRLGDYKTLSKHLINLLKNKNKKDEFGKNCIEAAKKYDWRILAKEYSKVLKSIK